MKYLALFEGFKEDFNIDYDAVVKKCEAEFGDANTAKYEADWYIDVLEDLFYKGGEIYRIVFLEKEEDLNADGLGTSWTVDEGCFSRIYQNIIGENQGQAYMITAKIPPKFVDVDNSIACFMILPQEAEVNLKCNPSNIKITKYEI